jgi:hypothetical protein
MEYTEEYTEQDFIEFKQQFILLAQDKFNACNNFVNQVEEADSPSRLKYVLIHFADEIYEKLGGEYDTSELDEEINDLENQIRVLEDNAKISDNLFPTVYDEMKFKIFVELHSKYTPWELEQLLKNGKL